MRNDSLSPHQQPEYVKSSTLLCDEIYLHESIRTQNMRLFAQSTKNKTISRAIVYNQGIRYFTNMNIPEKLVFINDISDSEILFRLTALDWSISNGFRDQFLKTFSEYNEGAEVLIKTINSTLYEFNVVYEQFSNPLKFKKKALNDLYYSLHEHATNKIIDKLNTTELGNTSTGYYLNEYQPQYKQKSLADIEMEIDMELEAYFQQHKNDSDSLLSGMSESDHDSVHSSNLNDSDYDSVSSSSVSDSDSDYEETIKKTVNKKVKYTSDEKSSNNNTSNESLQTFDEVHELGNTTDINLYGDGNPKKRLFFSMSNRSDITQFLRCGKEVMISGLTSLIQSQTIKPFDKYTTRCNKSLSDYSVSKLTLVEKIAFHPENIYGSYLCKIDVLLMLSENIFAEEFNQVFKNFDGGIENLKSKLKQFSSEKSPKKMEELCSHMRQYIYLNHKIDSAAVINSSHMESTEPNLIKQINTMIKILDNYSIHLLNKQDVASFRNSFSYRADELVEVSDNTLDLSLTISESIIVNNLTVESKFKLPRVMYNLRKLVITAESKNTRDQFNEVYKDFEGGPTQLVETIKHLIGNNNSELLIRAINNLENVEQLFNKLYKYIAKRHGLEVRELIEHDHDYHQRLIKAVGIVYKQNNSSSFGEVTQQVNSKTTPSSGIESLGFLPIGIIQQNGPVPIANEEQGMNSLNTSQLLTASNFPQQTEFIQYITQNHTSSAAEIGVRKPNFTYKNEITIDGNGRRVQVINVKVPSDRLQTGVHTVNNNSRGGI